MTKLAKLTNMTKKMNMIKPVLILKTRKISETCDFCHVIDDS